MTACLGGNPTGNGTTEAEKNDDVLLISYDIGTSCDGVAFLAEFLQVLIRGLARITT